MKIKNITINLPKDLSLSTAQSQVLETFFTSHAEMFTSKALTSVDVDTKENWIQRVGAGNINSLIFIGANLFFRKTLPEGVPDNIIMKQLDPKDDPKTAQIRKGMEEKMAKTRSEMQVKMNKMKSDMAARFAKQKNDMDERMAAHKDKMKTMSEEQTKRVRELRPEQLKPDLSVPAPATLPVILLEAIPVPAVVPAKAPVKKAKPVSVLKKPIKKAVSKKVAPKAKSKAAPKKAASKKASAKLKPKKKK